MTDHDQDAAIGALTKRHSDAKRKRAALVGEIITHRKALETFVRALEAVTPFDPLTSDRVPRMSKDYPDPAVLGALLSDLIAATHEIEHTQRLLKDAGIDVS